MMFYLKCAIFLCKITKTAPSFLLHPLDLIGGDQITALAFFPGMNISSERKIYIFKKVMKVLGRNFKLVTMEEHVQQILDQGKIKLVVLNETGIK